jgi:TPR repeat protein
MKWFTASADKGFAPAEAEMGWACLNSGDDPRYIPEALKWVRKAAEQGDVLGERLLGSMLERGLGTKHNTSEALGWYKKAAAQGDAESVLAVQRLSKPEHPH